MKYLSSNRPNGLIQSGFGGGGGREESYFSDGVVVVGEDVCFIFICHTFLSFFYYEKSQSFTARRLPLQPIPFRTAISCVHFLSLSFGNFYFCFGPSK